MPGPDMCADRGPIGWLATSPSRATRPRRPGAFLQRRGHRGRFIARSILADDADQDAEDVDLVAIDRLHRLVGGLEADAALLAEEVLERGLAVVVADGDDLAVAGL